MTKLLMKKQISSLYRLVCRTASMEMVLCIIRTHWVEVDFLQSVLVYFVIQIILIYPMVDNTIVVFWEQVYKSWKKVLYSIPVYGTRNSVCVLYICIYCTYSYIHTNIDKKMWHLSIYSQENIRIYSAKQGDRDNKNYSFSTRALKHGTTTNWSSVCKDYSLV